MASRLMLSLKKAVVEPARLWSLATIHGTHSKIRPQDGTLSFASRVPGRSHQDLGVTNLRDDEIIELKSVSKEPRRDLT